MSAPPPNEISEERTLVSPSGGDLLSLLVDKDVITAEQAETARRRMRRAAIPSHQAVMDLGIASEEDVFRAVAETNALPFMVLSETELGEDAAKKVPAKVALHYKFVPISISRGTLRAAFSSPPSVRDRQNLRLLLGLRLDPCIAGPKDIARTLKNIYGLGAETVLQIRQDRGLGRAADAVRFESTAGQDLTTTETEDDASITHLVNQMLVEALEMDTTDIHIEPFEDTVRLRYRIDGMLRDIPTPPGLRELHEAIVARLKVMADLNIAEHRLPHDGRIRVRVGEEDFDLRVSILPTRFGETLCLRILNRASIFLEMEQLGLDRQQRVILEKLVKLPHGIILVTGPTGSGKTTTLYAALAKVKADSPERKIITVEDPVEYVLEGTSQIQIRADIGLTFARGLRSILRHDPDIILVGEIRDAETAEIAIRSAMTGHLVLSTLHTNDSVGAVNRLIDMGIEPFLVAASLVASLAQRLVRRICPHCKEKQTEINPRLRAQMARSLGIAPEEVHAWKGKGCIECNYTGYRGRVAVFEIFLLDENIQDMVSRHASTSQLRHEAREHGMRTLRDDGWVKVQAGFTTIEEVTRITSTLDLTYEVPEDNEN
ncbi:MAG: type II/IV secretion system protein [Kiritimatiellaeota bacterium]|nr:type II/IV secretion system protein [Kiritimatiellota bacterium]